MRITATVSYEDKASMPRERKEGKETPPLARGDILAPMEGNES